ncbi:MAG: hypothetical protein QMC86_08345 [Methanothermobacter sp.]|nr:hypothetical protein [Methanothermobacter sp.]
MACKTKKYLCGSNSRAIFLLTRELGIRFFIILYELKNQETLECDFWVWEPKSEEEFDHYKETEFERYFKKYTNSELIEFMENL